MLAVADQTSGLMQAIGFKIRKQRRRLGLTLDELSERTRISKPYLSLIETGRVPPPSDEKLRRLEKTLVFNPGELMTYAHLQRTPHDVRAVLGQLLSRTKPATEEKNISESAAADLCGALAGIVANNTVPIVNRLSNGYPSNFTDLSYPSRVAEQFVGCPDLADREAFGACVYGDSMMPKYNEGDIVVFSPALPPRNGDDCFVHFGNGKTTFKRIFFETDGNGSKHVLRLQPRNERYRPSVVSADKISGLYRAIYRYQRVDEQ